MCKLICDLEEFIKYYFGKREKCNKSNVKIVRNNGSFGQRRLIKIENFG